MQADFQPLGDSAVRVGLGQAADEHSLRAVAAFCRRLETLAVPGVIEFVPAYTSATVFYEPSRISYRQLCLRLSEAAESAVEAEVVCTTLITIPVCYGGALGPDIEDMARHAGLSVEQVIELHSRPRYRVAMMGFAPGFGYLLGLPPELAIPRLATPRVSVPAGAVAIGGSQTGVYPVATPGGWRIIGHTPVRLYDAEAMEPFLLSPGVRVRFLPVDQARHDEIAEAVAKGRYTVARETLPGEHAR